MKIMVWTILLKPTRWKVSGSLVPFAFPLIQTFAELELAFDFLPLNIDLLLETPFVLVALAETFFAQPFAPILRALGWWSSNSIFVGPDGPLLLGSFVVAITYSVLIYIVWSLVSGWNYRRGLSLKK
jgi:hypothetical protein